MSHPARAFLRRKAGAAAVAGILLAVIALLMGRVAEIQQGREITAEHPMNVGSGIWHVTWRGQPYAWNQRAAAILVAGADGGSADDPESSCAELQAEGVFLVVLDELHQRTTVVALNPDTVTPVRGQMARLASAYAGEDGGESLCAAVSQLLYGVPVDGYVVIDRAAYPLIADAVGPVTVTVPNDDLASAWGLCAGQDAVIDETNRAAFLGAPGPAGGRMARQQAYLAGALRALEQRIQNPPEGFAGMMNQAPSFVHTNITPGRYRRLLNMLKAAAGELRQADLPAGRYESGTGDGFFPDEDKLPEQVIDLFYLPR